MGDDSDRVPGSNGSRESEKRDGTGREAAGGTVAVASWITVSSRPAIRSHSGSFSRLPAAGSTLPTRSRPWDRDEWDIAMADGTVYRLFVEREVGQWFLEGVFD